MKVMPILLPPAVKMSVVTAVSIIICQVIFNQSSSDLTVAISAFLLVTGLVLTSILVRNKIADFTYGIALGSSLLSNLFISTIVSAYIYIHRAYIIDYTPLKTSGPGLSEKDADMHEIINMMHEPINYTVGSFALYFTIGFLFSLLASLILKRNTPEIVTETKKNEQVT